MNDVLDKVWSKIVGGMDWLKAVIYGEFDDDRPISAIVADMLVSFVPGVIIVTSARDLTAVIIRLVRHPDKRDDVHEWMLIVACAIPLVLPVLAAAVGAAAAGVGAVVGGIAGSEAGAALRAVALMLIEKGGYMLAEVVGFLRRFVKGDVMAVLKDIKFAKYGGALVQYVGTFITKMRSLIRKLIEELRGYTWVSGVEDMIGKLNRLEREFYAVQTKAVGEIPKALAELDARLAKLLEQTLPKEEHLAYASVAPAEVKPIQHEPVRMAAMPNNPLGVPEGVSKTPPTYERVPESPNVHIDKTAEAKTEKEKFTSDRNEQKNTGKPKTRLPKANGHWEGEPGNGLWHSDLNDVNEITRGKPIEFVNGRPIFTPWSRGKIKFKPGQLDGSNADFDAVYDYVARQKGLASKNLAKNYLKELGVTPHHLDRSTIQLIPTKLHGNIPHIGSASDLRGGY
jgi:hypothetical protein